MDDLPGASRDVPWWKRSTGNVLLAICAIMAWVLLLFHPIVRLWRWWFGV